MLYGIFVILFRVGFCSTVGSLELKLGKTDLYTVIFSSFFILIKLNLGEKNNNDRISEVGQKI